MTGLHTTCPNCHTCFRVTAGQLKIAKGLVRCGECLSVFKAEDALPPEANVSLAFDNSTHTSPYQQEDVIKKDRNSHKKTGDHPNSPASDIKDDIPLLNIKAEKITLQRYSVKESVYTLIWLSLSILAVLLLLLQLAWFNRDLLNQSPTLSYIYKPLCHYFDCQKKAAYDLDLLEVEQLQLTPHPEYKQIVSVKVILINFADFAQQLPDMQLRFNDLQGRQVAERTFSVDQYAPELKQITPYERQTIVFDISYPKIRSVSYELTLLTPTTVKSNRR